MILRRNSRALQTNIKKALSHVISVNHFHTYNLSNNAPVVELLAFAPIASGVSPLDRRFKSISICWRSVIIISGFLMNFPFYAVPLNDEILSEDRNESHKILKMIIGKTSYNRIGTEFSDNFLNVTLIRLQYRIIWRSHGNYNGRINGQSLSWYLNEKYFLLKFWISFHYSSFYIFRSRKKANFSENMKFHLFTKFDI